MSARDDLAEDFVLGLLDPAEAEAVEARIEAPFGEEDAALARAVGAVRDRLLPLDLTAPELPLRPGAWDRLAARLGAAVPGATGADADAGPAETATAARRRPWRALALAAMAASLLLAVGLAWQVASTRPPAALVVLLDQAGEPVALLEAYADNSVRVTPVAGAEAGPSQVLQLWTKPDPEGAPVSVGLLQQVARTLLPGPDLPAPVGGQLYEITIEPEGGSPTGLPTGPVFGLGNALEPVRD